MTTSMGLLTDTQNFGLRMRRERFARHQFHRKPLVSDHGTCVTHVPTCKSGSQTRGGGENVPGIPGSCATRNFAYLARGPWSKQAKHMEIFCSSVSATNTTYSLHYNNKLKPLAYSLLFSIPNTQLYWLNDDLLYWYQGLIANWLGGHCRFSTWKILQW